MEKLKEEFLQEGFPHWHSNSLTFKDLPISTMNEIANWWLERTIPKDDLRKEIEGMPNVFPDRESDQFDFGYMRAKDDLLKIIEK